MPLLTEAMAVVAAAILEPHQQLQPIHQ